MFDTFKMCPYIFLLVFHWPTVHTQVGMTLTIPPAYETDLDPLPVSPVSVSCSRNLTFSLQGVFCYKGSPQLFFTEKHKEEIHYPLITETIIKEVLSVGQDFYVR
jgi:hypothetical protein